MGGYRPPISKRDGLSTTRKKSLPKYNPENRVPGFLVSFKVSGSGITRWRRHSILLRAQILFLQAITTKNGTEAHFFKPDKFQFFKRPLFSINDDMATKHDAQRENGQTDRHTRMDSGWFKAGAAAAAAATAKK